MHRDWSSVMFEELIIIVLLPLSLSLSLSRARALSLSLSPSLFLSHSLSLFLSQSHTHTHIQRFLRLIKFILCVTVLLTKHSTDLFSDRFLVHKNPVLHHTSSLMNRDGSSVMFPLGSRGGVGSCNIRPPRPNDHVGIDLTPTPIPAAKLRIHTRQILSGEIIIVPFLRAALFIYLFYFSSLLVYLEELKQPVNCIIKMKSNTVESAGLFEKTYRTWYFYDELLVDHLGKHGSVALNHLNECYKLSQPE